MGVAFRINYQIIRFHNYVCAKLTKATLYIYTHSRQVAAQLVAIYIGPPCFGALAVSSIRTLWVLWGQINFRPINIITYAVVILLARRSVRRTHARTRTLHLI